MYYDTVNI